MTPPPDIPEKEIRKRCAILLTGAADEARRLGHNYVGTEHIFIVATKSEGGATAGLLRRAGFNPRQVRNEIRREIGTGEGATDETLPITPRAEMVLSLAIFMADREESEEVDEAHVLLAMLQEGEGVPVRKLVEMGFNVNLWLQRLLNEAYEKDLASPDEGDLFQLSDLDLDNSPIQKRLWRCVVGDGIRQPFDHRRLAHASITQQERVVLFAACQRARH